MESNTSPVLMFYINDFEKRIINYKRQIKFADIFYAIKANDNPEILKVCTKQKLGFEVASLGEYEKVIKLGASPRHVITSNSVKSIDFIKRSYKSGLRYYSFDSKEELQKLVKFAPLSNLYVRLSVDNSGSDYPLSSKFGVEFDEALKLLRLAKKYGANIVGLNFHVGSQCKKSSGWKKAIKKSRKLFFEAEKYGINLNYLNLGGGLPAHYYANGGDVLEIINVIDGQLQKEFQGIDDLLVHIEPGRALVAESGTIRTQVIGKGFRNGRHWITLDVGIFNGLMELYQGFKYPVSVEKNRKTKLVNYIVYGPSCDSMDVLYESIKLPEVEIGDYLLIKNAGAYTNVYASSFNGFLPPRFVIK